jgi:hypothetical protein
MDFTHHNSDPECSKVYPRRDRLNAAYEVSRDPRGSALAIWRRDEKWISGPHGRQ